MTRIWLIHADSITQRFDLIPLSFPTQRSVVEKFLVAGISHFVDMAKPFFEILSTSFHAPQAIAEFPLRG